MRDPSTRRGLGALIIGRGASSIGAQVTFLCLPAAVVAVPGSSNALVAVFEGMTVLGFVVFAIPAGVIADRLRPHSVLLTCDLGRALCMLAAGWGFASAARSAETFPLVVAAVAVAVASVLGTQNDASIQRLIVDYGRDSRDKRAWLNSWLHGLGSTAQLVGPAVAGLLVATAGAALGLVLHAGTFVVSALALLFGWQWLRSVSTPAPAPDGSKVGEQLDDAVRSGWSYALEGFRIIRSHRLLAASTASIAMANLFSGVYGATYVVFVLRELKLGGEGLAVLGVSMAGGALLGASLTSRVVRLRGPIAVLTLAPFGYGLLMIVAAAPVGNLWLPAGAVFGYAIVSAMSAIAYVTFRQEAAAQSAAGRVAAASRAITGGVFSLSAMGAVLLLTLLPARVVVWIAVLGETASVAILVLAGGLTHLQKPRDAGRSLRVKSGGEG